MENIFVFIGFALISGGYFLLRSPAFKGGLGEKRVNATLRSRLDPAEYTLLSNLTLPTKSGTTQIDHIVLSKHGVFVIETKNMSGWIFGSADQSQWTQVLHRQKSRFQNPLRQNVHHIKVVQALLNLEDTALISVVAFVGSASPQTEMPAHVVWSTRELCTFISSHRPVLFTSDQLRLMTTQLEKAALEKDRQTRRSHIQHVKEKTKIRQTDTEKCPRCGSRMVARSNRKTGQGFLGCTRYPHCKGTRPLP